MPRRFRSFGSAVRSSLDGIVAWPLSAWRELAARWHHSTMRPHVIDLPAPDDIEWAWLVLRERRMVARDGRAGAMRESDVGPPQPPIPFPARHGRSCDMDQTDA